MLHNGRGSYHGTPIFALLAVALKQLAFMGKGAIHLCQSWDFAALCRKDKILK